MLEVLSNFICFLVMYVTGTYIVRKVVDYNPKITRNEYLSIIILAFVTVFLKPIQYTPLFTLSIFFLCIIVYKNTFKITIEKSTIVSSIFMVILIISDMIITTPLRMIYSVEEIRTVPLVAILTNLAIGVLSTEIIDIKIIRTKLSTFYNNIGQNKKLNNILLLILLVISFCVIGINFAANKVFNETYITNLVIMGIFTIISYIYIESRNCYKQLSDEYDTLFMYVQNFEDWIEKEQLNRHEYKNQLAVISSLTKDKKVISKIKEILDDNINIEGDVVHKLKELPKGGLKGLMYYKVAIAQKNNLKIEVDVSIKNKKTLAGLNEEQLKVLCKLIGIYFDNAIEAAIETEEKVLSLEVYNIKETLNIVLSNAYKEHNNFSNRNERGVTSKGEGHGNGLYYANKLLNKNKWIEPKQEIKDNYYIQYLKIKN